MTELSSNEQLDSDDENFNIKEDQGETSSKYSSSPSSVHESEGSLEIFKMGNYRRPQTRMKSYLE